MAQNETHFGNDSIGVYDRRQMGWAIARLALTRLENGMNYKRWEGEVQSTVSLPALKDADEALFPGTSGGAHGLYHNIDMLHDYLLGFDGFQGWVGAIFDSNFMPGLDIQDLDMDVGRSGTNPDFGEDIYLVGGTYREMMETGWEAKTDTECAGPHSTYDPLCLDRMHVLNHHVDTDYLVIQDVWDPNGGHLSGGSGYDPDFGQGDPALRQDGGNVCQVGPFGFADTGEYGDRSTGRPMPSSTTRPGAPSSSPSVRCTNR